MQITNTFYCSPLSGTLSYNTCLIRRNAKKTEEGNTYKYPFCASCEKGKKIKAKFPDWKHVKTSKKKRPDRIQLRTFKLKKSQVSLKEKEASESGISATEGGSVAEPEIKFSKEIGKLFDLELFVKAQTSHVFSLIRDKKKAEAKERIALIKKELTAQGFNHAVLKEVM